MQVAVPVQYVVVRDANNIINSTPMRELFVKRIFGSARFVQRK